MSDRTLRDFAHEACMLASMIEGIDVLQHESQGHEDCPIARRARNALPVFIEAAIQQAWALNSDLERAEMRTRQIAGKAVAA